MKYVIGIAPSRKSVRDVEGKSVPWCSAADCGKKVRLLIGDATVEFENARNDWPGSFSRASGGSADREPSKTEGFNLLSSVAQLASAEASASVLLLGLTYWKNVADMGARLGRLDFPRGAVPVGQPIPLNNDNLQNVGEVYLLPHPRNWPMVQSYSRSDYRTMTLGALAKQEILDGPSRKPLVSRDYDRVFAHFGF